MSGVAGGHRLEQQGQPLQTQHRNCLALNRERWREKRVCFEHWFINMEINIINASQLVIRFPISYFASVCLWRFTTAVYTFSFLPC